MYQTRTDGLTVDSDGHDKKNVLESALQGNS